MKPLLSCSVSILKQISSHPYLPRATLATQSPKKKRISAFTKPSPALLKQNYDYFFILDFEATCDNVEKPVPQEIIEHACLRFNTKSLEVDKAFHEYIRPVAHPYLTTFCTQLTGIMQENVDQAPTFDKVWSNFLQWLDRSKGSRGSFIFVTSGSWDLQYMLPQQLNYSQISPTDDFRRWIDLKKAFAKNYGRFPFGLKDMEKTLHLQHVGKLHNALDDCANIVNVVKKMIEDNKVLDETDCLKEQL